MGGARSVEMSRHNSLYVDVMAIENIIAAIDRAEEQLFSAIDSAMAYNVPSGRGDDDQPSAAPVSQPTAEPVERMNAYDQLAARVESEAHRKKPSAASGAVGKNSAAAAPVERETQRKKPGTRPVEAGRVIDVDGDEVLHVKDIRNDVQVLGAASASGRKEWKPTAEPAKSSLSKRTPAPVDMVGEPPKAALTMAAPSERAQPNPKRGESGSKSEVKPMRSMSAGTSAPTSAPSSAPKKVNPRNHNRHVPGGSSAIPSATLNGASRIPSRVPSSAASAPATIAGAAGALIPPAAPGVMYIPGVCAIGRTLPNGFRETPEGLRPVVTLAQRPKVPLAMRQTLADKLFSALKARDVSDMDAVVDTTLTEQRFVLRLFLFSIVLRLCSVSLSNSALCIAMFMC